MSQLSLPHVPVGDCVCHPGVLKQIQHVRLHACQAGRVKAKPPLMCLYLTIALTLKSWIRSSMHACIHAWQNKSCWSPTTVLIGHSWQNPFRRLTVKAQVRYAWLRGSCLGADPACTPACMQARQVMTKLLPDVPIGDCVCHPQGLKQIQHVRLSTQSSTDQENTVIWQANICQCALSCLVPIQE